MTEATPDLDSPRTEQAESEMEEKLEQQGQPESHAREQLKVVAMRVWQTELEEKGLAGR